MNMKRIAVDGLKKIDWDGLFKRLGWGDKLYENVLKDSPILSMFDNWKEDASDLGKSTESLVEYLLFPSISKYVSPGEKRVIIMQSLIDCFYDSNTFSLKRSMEIIMESVERLSQDYDIVPLIYTTLKLPSYVQYPSDIWRKIFGANSFKREHHGQLDFVEAILELRNKKLLNLNLIDIIYSNEEKLVIEANVTKTGKDLFIKNKSTQDSKMFFDKNSSQIVFGEKICDIPKNTHQYFLCKKMFDEPFGTRVKEIDILALIDWDKYTDSTKRVVYDAMRAVNKRIDNKFGLKNFFEWRNNHVWINEKLFKN